MLFALPTDLYYEALDLVTDNISVKDFGEALKQEFNRNPSSNLEALLPNVQSQFISAVTAINNILSSYAAPPMAPPLLVTPTTRQSGCEITRNSQDPEGQIRIRNYYRRFVYVIGHKPGSSEASVSEFVGMAKSVASFSTIKQFFKGNFDLAPSEASMKLPLTTQKDQFQAEVVGPTFQGPGYALKWKKEY